MASTSEPQKINNGKGVFLNGIAAQVYRTSLGIIIVNVILYSRLTASIMIVTLKFAEIFRVLEHAIKCHRFF